MEFDIQSGIQWSNRFPLLAAFGCSHDAVDETQSTAKPPLSVDINKHSWIPDKTATRKPSPVYLPNFSYNITHFHRDFPSKFGPSFTAKYVGKEIRIQFGDLDKHKTFMRALKNKNVSFYSFSLKEDKGLTLVLKPFFLYVGTLACPDTLASTTLNSIYFLTDWV